MPPVSGAAQPSQIGELVTMSVVMRSACATVSPAQSVTGGKLEGEARRRGAGNALRVDGRAHVRGRWPRPVRRLRRSLPIQHHSEGTSGARNPDTPSVSMSNVPSSAALTTKPAARKDSTGLRSLTCWRQRSTARAEVRGDRLGLGLGCGGAGGQCRGQGEGAQRGHLASSGSRRSTFMKVSVPAAAERVPTCTTAATRGLSCRPSMKCVPGAGEWVMGSGMGVPKTGGCSITPPPGATSARVAGMVCVPGKATSQRRSGARRDGQVGGLQRYVVEFQPERQPVAALRGHEASHALLGLGGGQPAHGAGVGKGPDGKLGRRGGGHPRAGAVHDDECEEQRGADKMQQGPDGAFHAAASGVMPRGIRQVQTGRAVRPRHLGKACGEALGHLGQIRPACVAQHGRGGGQPGARCIAGDGPSGSGAISGSFRKPSLAGRSSRWANPARCGAVCSATARCSGMGSR